MAITADQREKLIRIRDKNMRALEEGVKYAQASTEVPDAQVGVLARGIPAWVPDTLYEKMYTLFTYNGKVGFTKQANLTSSSVYPPFSTGTEALYGVRSIPDDDGIYPYEYNMAAIVGMKVRYNDEIYECIQNIDTLIYTPDQVPAHFIKQSLI